VSVNWRAQLEDRFYVSDGDYHFEAAARECSGHSELIQIQRAVIVD